MAAPSYTHTLTNGTTADASQVMQNFNDLLNGITDGTKDLAIAGFTCSGNVSFEGNVTLGNGSVDDLTINASLASSIPVKTNNSFNIGSSTLGLASVYLGSAGGFTTRLVGAATASYTLTFPVTGGTAGDSIETNGSGTLSFLTQRSPSVATNYGITATVATNALTVALKAADGNDASSTNPVRIVFRNSTAATGTPVTRSVTGSLSVIVTSGATLGHTDADVGYVHVYAIDNAGTVELAVAGSKIFDELALNSSTSVTNASDDYNTLYSTTGRSNVAIRYLGRVKSTQATAGTWVTTPSEISLAHEVGTKAQRHTVRVSNGNATSHGSTNTKIRRFATTVESRGTAITYADSGTLGGSFTINEPGVYAIAYSELRAGASCLMGISRNSTQLTTGINGITNADVLAISENAADHPAQCGGAFILDAGDVIRAHTDGNPGSTDVYVRFTITKLGD